jgi:hypothetical protein
MNLLETVKDYWWMLKNYTPDDIKLMRTVEQAIEYADKVVVKETLDLTGEAPNTNVVIIANEVNLKGSVSLATFGIHPVTKRMSDTLFSANPRKASRIRFSGKMEIKQQ